MTAPVPAPASRPAPTSGPTRAPASEAAPPAGFAAEALAGLLRDPEAPATGRAAGATYAARLAIPHYRDRLARHYGTDPRDVGLDFAFEHFGVEIEFAAPVELALYDEGRVLDAGLRALIARFGPVVLRNAYLPARSRAGGQRNIFQSLSFHLDRGPTQPDGYSLFQRDPFDPVQRAPRSSATLVLANAAAYLQALEEGAAPHAFRRRYTLFAAEDVAALAGRVLFAQRWDAPEGTGELAVLDNRTVLHASYYRRPEARGYPIGVRYLF